MMDKKGQITFFIIVGVIFILLVLFFILFNNTSFEVDNVNSLDTGQIQSYVTSCIETTAEKGIYFISLQGGYYETSVPYQQYAFMDIPIYWDSQSNIPDKYVIEQELIKYIKAEVNNCLNNFTFLKKQGYDITNGSIVGNAVINDNGIVLNIEYPLRIIFGEEQGTIDRFKATIDFDFQRIYGIVNKIITEQIKTPNDMPLGYISYLAFEENFLFETVSIEKDVILFELIFNDTYNGQPFIYAFVSKYNWSNLDYDNSLYVEPIPSFIINESSTFEYTVRANGSNVQYSDYTGLFDIHESTGLIIFNTDNVPNGEHNILIKVVDENGNEGYAYMHLTVDMPNQKPIINPIGDLTVNVAEEFVYTVQASDPSNTFLTYLDDTGLFNIHPMTGKIKFTPTLTGNYSIKITALNGEGHSFEYMRLEVI